MIEQKKKNEEDMRSNEKNWMISESVNQEYA